jgi:RNA-directed DNA polymerase
MATLYRYKRTNKSYTEDLGVPIFDRTFIATSYANRKGYGSHRALKQFVEYARSSRYVLQCDIRKYFPSIDILILKSFAARRFLG